MKNQFPIEDDDEGVYRVSNGMSRLTFRQVVGKYGWSGIGDMNAVIPCEYYCF